MGYLWKQISKEDLVAELTTDKEWINSDGAVVRRIVEKHRLAGSQLWTINRVEKDGVLMDRFIALDLISVLGPMAGYNSYTEDDHPYYYTVPVTWFALVPCPDSLGARSFRSAALGAHAARKTALRLKNGDRIRVEKGLRFADGVTETDFLVGKEGRTFTIRRASDLRIVRGVGRTLRYDGVRV